MLLHIIDIFNISSPVRNGNSPALPPYPNFQHKSVLSTDKEYCEYIVSNPHVTNRERVSEYHTGLAYKGLKRP